jgi:hypothetical protein
MSDTRPSLNAPHPPRSREQLGPRLSRYPLRRSTTALFPRRVAPNALRFSLWMCAGYQLASGALNTQTQALGPVRRAPKNR